MRKWLIDKREALGLDKTQMSEVCECTRTMIIMLEDDDEVTHPNIATRIALGYGLNVDEYNMLVPKKKRSREIPAYVPKPTLDVLFSAQMREKLNERGELYWDQQ